MRALPGVLLVYTLAVLLVTSSPIGTGQGVHRDQLLDVLLPHVHFLNGQRIQPGEAVPVRKHATAGPALGAGATATTVGGEALAPVPRAYEPLLAPVPSARRLTLND